MSQVAAIELVDLDRHLELASTLASNAQKKLVLSDDRGRTVLPSATGTADLPAPGRNFRLTFPSSIRLEDASYPAARLLDASGRRLLTLPVIVEAIVPSS